MDTEQPISLINVVSYKSLTVLYSLYQTVGLRTCRNAPLRSERQSRRRGCGERTLEIKVILKKEEEYTQLHKVAVRDQFVYFSWHWYDKIAERTDTFLSNPN